MVSQKIAHIKPSNLFSTSIDKNVVISFDETLVNAKLKRLAALESDVYYYGTYGTDAPVRSTYAI